MNTTTTDITPTLDSNEATYVELSIPDGRVSNWRILVNWLLAIPHWIVRDILVFVGFFIWLLLGPAVLLAGRVPGFCYRYLLGLVRYYNCINGYMFHFFTRYPAINTYLDDPVDSSGYQMQTHFCPNPGKVSRWRIFRPILAIPHLFFFGVLYYVDLALKLVGGLYGLLTGRYPEWLRKSVQALVTYQVKVLVYTWAIGNKYPPWPWVPHSAPAELNLQNSPN